MKFSLKTLAMAVALAASGTGANAAIDNGAAGNGELFFSIWDANGSYTRSLETLISNKTTTPTRTGFEGYLAEPGLLKLSWAADETFTKFLKGQVGGARTGDPLNWNVAANDSQGAFRLLTTYTLPEVAPVADNLTRSAAGNAVTFIAASNLVLNTTPGTDSFAVISASPAFAGNGAAGGFGKNFGGLMNFSNTGTLDNNSFASGLGFMRINAANGGIANSVYNEYFDPASNLVADVVKPLGGTDVRVYLDANNTLHIQAVPEPESYAMLLAGLGMLGFMARRRLNNRV